MTILPSRCDACERGGLELADVVGDELLVAATIHARSQPETPLPAARATAMARRVGSLSAFAAVAQALCSDGALSAVSAGSHPKPLHPHAVQVMRRGIDIAERRSKHLSEFAGRRFDYVISLCDRVRELCPEFPGAPETIHWSIPDPAREETLPAFERTAAQLETRIDFLIEAIKASRQEEREHA